MLVDNTFVNEYGSGGERSFQQIERLVVKPCHIIHKAVWSLEERGIRNPNKHRARGTVDRMVQREDHERTIDSAYT